MFKESCITVVVHLKYLFNKILSTGQYPDKWCEAILTPIHKKGSINDENNYRGIALLCIMSKIFTKVINNRLTKWAQDENKMYEEQGGFLKGKSTVDQIFVLYAMASNYLTKSKGRFYCVFVDFSKAFDTVPHSHLFYKLIKDGLHGKTLKVLQNMYSKLKTCVQSNDGLTELFDCSVGTRQGCMLSPFLFIFYLNELIEMCKENLCQGIYISEDAPNICMLLYADDLANCGDTVGRVQHQLNVLADFCYKWGLSANLQKTQVMIFRNGGIIKKKEKFYLNGVKIEPTTYYKYLGLLFSSSLKWTKARQTLATQAQRGMVILNKMLNKCGHVPASVAFTMFDKMIVPILTYAAEIWGFEYSKEIEQVHHKFCKRVLGVSNQTCNIAALGELGRYPLYCIYVKKCLKFWLKLIKMDNTRYPKACYNMLLNLDENGRTNWVTHVKNVLCQNGFGYVWHAQEVGCEESFILKFVQRIKDCKFQEWVSEINDKEKLRTYKLFKSLLDPEKYLQIIQVRKHAIALARFRTSSHTLEIEMGRRSQTPSDLRYCKLCKRAKNINLVENEYHVVMSCSSYNKLRFNLLPIKYCKHPSIENFILLMKDENPEIISSLALFIYKMFSERAHLLSLL